MDDQLQGGIGRWVADALVRPIPELTPRDVGLVALPNKVDALVGMRRSGKTWVLYDHARRLMARGVPRSRIVPLNFEDERLAGMTGRDLGAVWDAILALHPEHANGEVWLLLDEIQDVPGWDKWVRRLVDRGGVRIAVTGSSAKLLSTEIATSLRGRSLATEVLPFSFAEALRHEGIEVPKRWPPPEAVRATLENRFLRYLDVGGFPEVQTVDDAVRRRVLADYVDVAVLRDVIERHQVTNPAALRWLVRRLLASPGGPFTANKAYLDLKAQGRAVAKDTVHAYVDAITEAYLALPVPAWGRSERSRAVRPRKIYAVDHALGGLLFGAGLGPVLENAVYTALRRQGYAVSYVTTARGTEVDFLAEKDGERRLVQACASMAGGAEARELRAIEDALPEVGLKHAEIVTLDPERTEVVRGGKVAIVPAWKWFLSRSRGM